MGSVYGNGSSRNYTYDALGRLIAETNDDYPIEPVYEYFYDNSGNLAILKDKLSGTETRYVYDLADRLVRMEDSAGLTVTYEYDDAGRQHKLSYTVGGETVTQEMTYGEGALADRPSGLKVNDVPIKSYTYDSLNRVTKTTLNTTAPVETNYTYLNHPTTANQTSSVVAGVKVGANAQYTYSYDQNGNIIRENKGGYTKYSYSYDEKGQLTGFSDADVYYDDAPSEYWYEYDDAGNLTDVYFGNSQDEERVAQYQYTDSSWGDLLTSFNGQAITYDAIGNPLNYYDGNIFTWENGRQLVSWEHGSGVTYGSLEYDSEGYRASKTTENGETSYLYSGGSLLRETKTNPTTNATVYDLYFTYDEAGRPFSISSYGETLYYFYDIYGNVKYLYDAYGNLVAEYTYHDPWGNDVELTCHYFEGFSIAEINPFTYKGYYYDADLDMYYCGSRYYDPETCRWINADGYVTTGQGVLGNNMYAYCLNNPVIFTDIMGYLCERTAGGAGSGNPYRELTPFNPVSVLQGINVALEFLNNWVSGDGSFQTIDSTSTFSQMLHQSPTMQEIVNDAVNSYGSPANHKPNHSDEFSFASDGPGLYLSTQHFSYTTLVTKNPITFVPVSSGKFDVIESYTVEVIVSDTYDFDPKPWDTVGNYLNNIANIAHTNLGIGVNYGWKAYYRTTVFR